MALSKAAQDLEKEFAEYEERRKVRQTDAWRPEPGTRFKGEVVGLRMGGQPEPLGYGYYPIIIYRNMADDTTFAVHAFHTTLRETYKELADGEPTNLLKQVHFVSYSGKKKSNTRKDKDGQPVEYHLYDVEQAGKETKPIDTDFTF